MKKLLLLAACFFAVLIGGQSVAHADVNTFVIHDFDSDMTLTKGDPQGELHVIEHINLTFTDNNHGILRALPEKYNGHRLLLKVNGVSSETGAPSEYTTYGSNGNEVLKIGDPSRTVTGNQSYTIDYTVKNVINFKDDNNFFWNVNGTEWSQTFEHVSATLHDKSDGKYASEPICYTGGVGSTAKNCIVTKATDGFKVETTKTLYANQNLSYGVHFAGTAFTPYTAWDDATEYLRNVIAFFVPILLIGGGGFVMWWRSGRDAKGRSTIIPEYDPPEGMKPLVAGTLLDFKTDSKDITATIIDFAIRKYYKIVETRTDRTLLPDSLSYKLVLLNADFSALDPIERELMEALFTSPTVGAERDITSLKNKLYETAASLSKDAKDFLKTNDYYKTSPFFTGKNILRAALILIYILLEGFANLGSLTPDRGWVIAGFTIGLLIFAICLVFLSSRTEKGVEARNKLLGLKMYMDVAEKDRIAKLQSPNAPYASNSAEPVKTVELFEKLLPYAIVLGVENKWATQFADIYKTPPDWYNGNWSTFNSIYFVNSLNSGISSSVNQAFSAPSSSGSGGFSGGGGGGGGGGGW